jgi:hypothetical protein
MGTKMSKKSVVTITVMACLLAVAVATTIVLAAFQANKTATTAIQFSNGVQIRVAGAYAYTSPGPANADVVSQTATNLVWGVKEGAASTFQGVDSITNVSNYVTMEPISFVNGGENVSTDAWFIAKATITSSNSTHQQAVSITRGSGWVQIGSTDWYAYGSTTSGTVVITDGDTQSTSIAFTTVPAGTGNEGAAEGTPVSFVTAANINPTNISESTTIDALASASFTATVSVYAINAGAADAAAVLSGIVYPTQTP